MLLNHLAKHWPRFMCSMVTFFFSVSLISGMPYWVGDKEAETLRIGYVCSHSWSKSTGLNGYCVSIARKYLIKSCYHRI